MKKHVTEHKNRSGSLHRPWVTVVENAKDMGIALAVQFLCWVHSNPHGVVSLPTGKTPEMFIKALRWCKEQWSSSEVQSHFVGTQLAGQAYPDTTQLYFVQMDEFYFRQVHPDNLFYTYIKNQYQPVLGFSDERFLSMDYAAMCADAAIFQGATIAELYALTDDKADPDMKKYEMVVSAIQQFLPAHEARIKALGGIGFFVGGIGPDGHIAFNMPGSLQDSLTRIVHLNYETSAASARSFGGFSNAVGSMAITIGFGTLRYNKQAQLYIIASGVGKAEVIKQALVFTKPTNRVPASLLPQERLHYIITKAAATALPEHQQKIDLSRELLFEKIERGLEGVQGKTILHTSPHHDDEMLGYFSYMVSLLDGNTNHFAYVTSGFNSVADDYLRYILEFVQSDLEVMKKNIFNLSKPAVLKDFLKAFTVRQTPVLEMAEVVLAAQLMHRVYKDKGTLEEQVAHITAYLDAKYPGQSDDALMKEFKALIRESEAERMLHVLSIAQDSIAHLRCAFYHEQGLTQEQAFDKDVAAFLAYLNRVKPDIITVIMDPEGTGPDTHYKSLLVIAQALRLYEGPVQVFGYRNIWHTFTLDEVTDVVLVAQEEMRVMKYTFMSCFASQKDPEFPSVHYNGPFCDLAEIIQKRQLKEVKQYIQASYISGLAQYDSPVVGAIYLKKMSKEQFVARAPVPGEYSF